MATATKGHVAPKVEENLRSLNVEARARVLPRQKVVHLTSVHQPFDTRIFHKECKTLREAGYDVVLVAPHKASETVDGVRIHAVPPWSNRRERTTRTILAVLRAALAEDAVLYHFHDPELIPVGMYLKARGKRVIYDVHEHVPHQIMAKYWLAPWTRRFASIGAATAEALGGRLFDGIVGATSKITNRFPSGKSVAVRNYPMLGELLAGQETPYRERPPAVAYVGVITAERSAPETVRALELLPADSNVRLTMAGQFSPESLKDELERMPGWSRVDFLGWQSRGDVAALLGRARAGVVLFHAEPHTLLCQPNKLFEYMSAGLPVIACDLPLVREIVDEVECGLLVDPGDPRAIAEAIQWLGDHPEEAEAMGRRAQAAVTTKYNWHPEAEKLLALYEGLLK